MARMNDNSPHPRDWTTAKLFRELNDKANLRSFGGHLPFGYEATSFGNDDTNAIREATRLYRQTWLQPIIDELARRAKVTL